MTTLARYLLFAVALLATFSIPKLNLDQILGENRGSLTTAVAAVVAFVALLLARRFGGQVLARLRRAAAGLAGVPDRRWLIGCLIGGLLFRLGWAALFRFEQQSDAMTYTHLARQLAHGGAFEVGGFRSNWPPGFPLLLAVLYRFCGDGRWVHIGLNLGLFVASLGVVHALARSVAGSAGARLATLALTVWPNAVMTTGVAAKELLVLLLLPLAFWSFLRAGEKARWAAAAPWLALTGLTLGAATLVQPGLMLLPAALAVHELWARRPLPALVGRLAIVGLVMICAILPWTFRNHAVLGEWVLVSTNGGDVFYRANNPLATGGYTLRGERDLDEHDEILRSRQGFAFGKEWIAGNPGAFLRLMARKQVLFLGDDSTGAYETLRRGDGSGGGSGLHYLAAKGISNGFWLVIWLLLLALSFERGLFTDRAASALWLAGMGFLFLFATHSVFESNGKYHVPALALLAVMLAGVARAPAAAPAASRPT